MEKSPSIISFFDFSFGKTYVLPFKKARFTIVVHLQRSARSNKFTRFNEKNILYGSFYRILTARFDFINFQLYWYKSNREIAFSLVSDMFLRDWNVDLSSSGRTDTIGNYRRRLMAYVYRNLKPYWQYFSEDSRMFFENSSPLNRESITFDVYEYSPQSTSTRIGFLEISNYKIKFMNLIDTTCKLVQFRIADAGFYRMRTVGHIVFDRLL